MILSQNILLILTIKILIFIQFNCLRVKGIQEQVINYVYRAFPDLHYTQDSPNTQYNQIVYNKKANLIFLQDSKGNISIFDGTQKNKLINTLFIESCINGIIVSADGKNIICYSKQKFMSYKIIDIKKQLTEQLYVYTLPDSKQIIQIQIDTNEEYLFLATIDGIISIFKFNGFKSFVQFQQYQHFKASFVGFKLSNNKNYIIVEQSYQGLYVLKLTWQPNQKDVVQIQLAGSFIQQTSYSSYIFSDESAIIALDYWGGIQIGLLDQIQKADQSQYPIKLVYKLEQWWQFDDPMPYCLTVNEQRRLLYVGSRSQGIFIIDISDFAAPVLKQQIPLSSYAMSIQVSPDVKHIYYTNREEFFIFSLTQPNLQNNYLNFFNFHQSNLTEVQDTKWLWRCSVDAQDRYLFSASDIHGFQIYNVEQGPNELKLLFSLNKNSEYFLQIDDFVFLQNESYIVVPYGLKSQSTVFRVYDIRDLANIKIVTEVLYNTFRTTSGMRKSSNDRYIVASYEQSILVLDCFDFLIEQESQSSKQIKVVGEYEFFEVNKDITSDATFILNDKYIIICFSYFGFAVVQFTPSVIRGGQVRLTFLQTYQTYGGETIIVSDINPNIGFISDGLNGILIVNFESLPMQVSEISRLPLQGWINHILLVNNETQLVASSIDQGYITVVDISDILNPFVVTEFIFREKYNFSSCKSINKDYFFFNTERGIRGFLMKQQSLVHTDIAQIEQDNNYLKVLQSEPLKIGQSIVMKINLIYPKKEQLIQQKQPLPSNWMQFDQSSKQLLIKVSREGLASQSEQISQNIVVVLTIFRLNLHSFIYNNTLINDNIDCKYITTTPAESALIFDYLQKKGYIDWKTGIVNPDMMQDNIIYFEINGVQSSDRLFKAVTHTLQQSYSYNPIYFNIQSSLNFDLKSNNNTFVSSLSSQISITLSFYQYVEQANEEAEYFSQGISGVPGGAIFLNQIKTFTMGLTLTLSKGGTILKIEGTQSKINEFFSEKIVYWYQNPTNQQYLQNDLVTPQNVFVVILIQDLINYDMKQIYPLKDVPFLNLKGPIKQKGINNIMQMQFDKEYSDGIVFLNQEIDIQLEKESFYDSDGLDIQYFVTFENGDAIPPDYWLQFQPSAMRLYGLVPQSIFRDVVVLRIVAQNNYTIYWNELRIKAYGVPFLYVLELLAKIVSPVLFLIGLYRFKYVLYNAFLRHKNRYSDEISYINHSYRKKIPLIGQDLQIARFLVEGLKQIAALEQSEIRKRDRINSRKRTTKTNKTSPFLTAPDAANNTFILNLSYNTQPKEINSPPISSSRHFPKTQKSPLTVVQNRRGSLFREEYMKSSSQKIKQIPQLVQQYSENLNDRDGGQVQLQSQQNVYRSRFKNLNIDINYQARSLPNIPDEEFANHSEKNYEQTQNQSMNEQIQNLSSYRQELISQRRHSSQATSELHQSPHSNYPLGLNESPKITGRQVNFDEGQNKDKFFDADFVIQVNNQTIHTDTPKSALKQIPNILTNRSNPSNYQTPSRSHFNPSRAQINTQDTNQFFNKVDRRGTLDNDQTENTKNDLLHTSKNTNSINIQNGSNNIVIFSQINEEQEERDSNSSKQASYSDQGKNQKKIKIGGFLNPHADNSQNWGQDMSKNSRKNLKRQMSISPMGDEFKRKLNSLKNVQKKNQKINKQRTVFEVKYMEENGNICMDNVINDIIQQNTNFVFQMKRYHASDFILELRNKDSILYIYIRSLIARYLLSLDRQSTLVYNILKSYALQNFSFTSNDWYKVYLDIQAMQESDMYGFQITFPQLLINQTQMNRAIRSLLLFEPNNDEQSQNDEELNPSVIKHGLQQQQLQQNTSQLSQNQPIFSSFSQLNFHSKHSIHGFNQNLIEEVIKADALGLINKEPSKRFPCVGESLHIKGYEVDSVEAFSIQKRDKSFCSKIREIFGLNYHRYGSNQNIKLPSWINFYQKQNLIFLEGTPSSHDIEEILIRIYNSQRYIIKEFVLKITNEYNFLSDSNQKQQEAIIQDKKIQLRGRISSEDKPFYHTDINRSPKLTSTSNYSNSFLKNVHNQDQIKQAKSITNINQQNNNDILSSPSSLSQISITSHNKLQLLSEEQEKFSYEQNFHRIPQASETHRFIQDINPLSGYCIPQFQGIKRLYESN